MVEHRTFNPLVVGSSPTGSIVLGVETKMETTTRKVAEELFSIAPGDGLEEKYKTKSRKKKHESTTYVISVLK